jgi:tRNA-specific 2-thiouridylase
MHQDGRVLGLHRGLAHYTVGQAKGLGLDPHDGSKLFVLRLEAAQNRVVVGPLAALGGTQVKLAGMNWLAQVPHAPIRVGAKLRGRETPRAAMATANALVLDEPATAAPGQAAVLYDGERVLGGGVIARG